MADVIPTIRRQIRDAGEVLRELMSEHVTAIGQDLVQRIMREAKKLPESARINATKNLEPRYARDYEAALLGAFALIADRAIKQARKEIKPKTQKASAIFDDLPLQVRRRIKNQAKLVVGKNLSDLTAILFFQYGTSAASTDSLDQIEGDLILEAEDFAAGAAMVAGGDTNASMIINEARSAYFLDDDVRDQIAAFKFVNGDPVTQICKDLAGTIFRTDQPDMMRYWPPLHFNCKSFVVPIPAGKLGNREITELKPSTKKIEKMIQFSLAADPSGCCPSSDFLTG